MIPTKISGVGACIYCKGKDFRLSSVFLITHSVERIYGEPQSQFDEKTETQKIARYRCEGCHMSIVDRRYEGGTEIEMLMDID